MPTLNPRRLSTTALDFDDSLTALLQRDDAIESGVEQTVGGIITAVKSRGDEALIEFTRRYDQFAAESVDDLIVSPQRLQQALADIDAQVREALIIAGERIRSYHQKQRQDSWYYTEQDGTRLGQKITPLDRVGVYVPGGKAAYPSSVLMNVIPAQVAGVSEIILVTPAVNGDINNNVLAAAALVGVDRVFAVGGAQAVAALAYGTANVPKVDKIVGPGNIYVATAKKMVFGQVGIDMIAGPSEVVIVCDDSVEPEWVAMDLFAQAEHDELTQSVAISHQGKYLDKVQTAMEQIWQEMERRDVIQAAINGQGALIETRTREESIAVANRIAPEHLELLVSDPEPLLQQVTHAGAVFAGKYSAESLGDYCAGPNHVLPTAGTARFSSPLGVYDFQKRTSVIHCSAEGAATQARTASVLARAEGLTSHARSAEYRK